MNKAPRGPVHQAFLPPLGSSRASAIATRACGFFTTKKPAALAAGFFVVKNPQALVAIALALLEPKGGKKA